MEYTAAPLDFRPVFPCHCEPSWISSTLVTPVSLHNSLRPKSLHLFFILLDLKMVLLRTCLDAS
jgi:hypothetical protein